MAQYTIELRDVVSHYPIFDFPYPFYDEKKRKEFETSFVRHFYFREIGTPTVEQFKHYLEDKFLTVFPYYNELFYTANIEYSVLDNYSIKETFDRTVEGIDKSNAVVSNVGRTEDSQHSETDENREGTNASTTTGKGTSKIDESNQETETGNSNTERNGSELGNNSKDTTSNGTDTKHDIKRYLDTPQGKLTLKDEATYLTNLNEDDSDETHKNTVAESGSDSRETSGSEETNTTRNTNGSKNTTGNTTDEQTTNGTDSSTGKTVGQFEGERVERQDGNTRHESVANRNEHYELTKKGNIGVDTDADMIQKHINLQKVLKKIETMFFEECEDLFMMVY